MGPRRIGKTEKEGQSLFKLGINERGKKKGANVGFSMKKNRQRV